MRVDLFDFDLPAELIALRPAKPRDSARLLLVEGEAISDKTVLDLLDAFEAAAYDAVGRNRAEA